MPSDTAPTLSISALFADRDAKRRREREQEEQLRRRKEEELAAYRQRLEDFRVTDEHRQTIVARIRRAFEKGDTELMLASFPCGFCTDNGRAIINSDAPPINKPDPNTLSDEPEWIGTMPAGAKSVYAYWKNELKPGGFKLGARIISYPDGMPGEVGLFFTWPKSMLDEEMS